MIELMKPEFDKKESERRVGLRVKKWVNESMCALPNGYDAIVTNITKIIIEYVRELVMTHGQENRYAESQCVRLTAGVRMLKDCGLFPDGQFRIFDFQMMMRDLVFDELRRYGIRKYSGIMEHPPICIPPIPSCDE